MNEEQYIEQKQYEMFVEEEARKEAEKEYHYEEYLKEQDLLNENKESNNGK